MDTPSLAPNPIAQRLLEFARQQASGSIRLRDRTLILVDGRCQSVQGNTQDEPLDAFIVRSGRLDEGSLATARAEAAKADRGLVEQLQLGDMLSARELQSLRRSLYLDRLVRSMRELGGDATPLTLDPAPAERQAAEPCDLVTLVLDALTRLAADGAAGAVGAQMRRVLYWTDSDSGDEAREWADFGELPERATVASVLARQPAAVPRIAALLLAGVAKLRVPSTAPTPSQRPRSSTGSTLPPPPPRLQLMPAEAPVMSEAPLPEPARVHAQDDGGGRATVLPPRVVLTPGETTEWLNLTIDENYPRFEKRATTLDDPLRVIELYIDSLEHHGGDNAQRSAAFVELAELWMTRIGCLEEATRAMREAAATDPANVGLLVQTANYCQAMGDGPLAIAYLQAAGEACNDLQERSTLLTRLAWTQLSRGNLDEARSVLREAAALEAGLPGPHERLAALTRDRREASTQSLAAASMQAESAPERTLALLAEAHMRDPQHAAAVSAYATALAKRGDVDASVTLLLGAARQQLDPDVRRSLLLEGAERAESHGLSILAAELLLAAYDAEPHVDLLYPPLHQDLTACEDRALHAAVLQDIALSCPDDQRAVWLECAAEALRLLDEEEDQTRLLFQQLLAIAPDSEAAAAYLGPERSDDAPNLDGIAQGLTKRLQQVNDSAEEQRLLRRLTGLHHARGDARSTVSCCLKYLALDPDDAMVVARLCRATSQMTDPVLRREALGHRVRTAPAGASRVRALCQLAHDAERMGDIDAAVSAADAAITADRSATDAALLLLRNAKQLPAARSELLLRRIGDVLGESRRLLAALARATLDAGDDAQWARTLRRWTQLFPHDPAPRSELLVTALAGPDAGALVSAAEELLECPGGHADTVLVERAADRLVQLGRTTDATELLLHMRETLGMRDLPLAERTLEQARLSGRTQLVARAMEGVIIASEGDDRARALRELATHHARTGDTLAELRTYIRLLGAAPSDHEALSRLRQLFDEGGDYQRLMIVLSVAQQATDDPDERNTLWLQLASMAAQLMGDEARCDEYLTAMMRERVGDHGWIGRGLGLLFGRLEPQEAVQRGRAIADHLDATTAAPVLLVLSHACQRRMGDLQLAAELAQAGIERDPSSAELLLTIEQLALDLDDLELGLRTYGIMQAAALGPHSKRSLHYRAGRWLERAQRPKLALDEYVAAFRLSPGLGVALRAIERLAPEVEAYQPLVDTYRELVARIADPGIQQDYLALAGDIALQQLDDPAQAFDLLRAAMPDDGSLDDRTLAAARLLAARAQEAGREALGELAGDWAARLDKLWDGEVKVRCLLRLASLWLEDLGDVSAALSQLDTALAVVEEGALDQDARLAVLCAQGDALRRLGKPEQARAVVRAALSIRPDSTAALELQQRLGPGPADEQRTPDQPPGQAIQSRVDTDASYLGINQDDVDTAQPLDLTDEVVMEPSSRPPSAQHARALGTALPADASLAAPAIPSELVRDRKPSPLPTAPALRGTRAKLGKTRTDTESFAPIPLPAVRPTSVVAVGEVDQGDQVDHVDQEAPTAKVESVPPASEAPAEPPVTQQPSFDEDTGAVRSVIPTPESQSFFPEDDGPEEDDDAAGQAQRDQVDLDAEGLDVAEVVVAPVASAASSPGLDPERERSLRQASADGDLDARITLAQALADRPERRTEAHQLLAGAVQASPGRTEALRMLHQTALALGADAETIVTSQLLALFDDSVLPANHGPLSPTMFGPGELSNVMDDAPAEVTEMLTLLWEATRGIPQCRRHITSYGVQEHQRLSPSDVGPIANAYAAAVNLVGTRSRPPLFLRQSDVNGIEVTATDPPAVVISRGMADDPQMPVHLARALSLADPARALFSALPEHDARGLLAACVVAFGPRGAAPQSDPDAMRLAGALWDTAPKATQQRLSELAGRHHGALDYDDLRTRALRAAARAALFVSADPGLTLHTLGTAAPQLQGINVKQATGFTVACERSEEFADVVRTALSDHYLAAVARLTT